MEGYLASAEGLLDLGHIESFDVGLELMSVSIVRRERRESCFQERELRLGQSA